MTLTPKSRVTRETNLPPMSSPSPSRFPLVALMAASMIGSSACAQNAAAPAPAAPIKVEAAPAPAEIKAETAAKPETKPETPAAAKPEGDKPAAEAPKPLSPEEQAKADARKKIDAMTMEKMLIDAKLELASIETRKAREAETAELARIAAETALASAKLAAETAAEDEAKAANERAIALAGAKAMVEQAKLANEARITETETKLAKAELDLLVAKTGAAANKRKRESEAEKFVNIRQEYPAQPFQNGVLRISDRRIPFDGPVTDALAQFVVSRINFYNKRDPKAPIFIVIENSPGGSVTSGYQILKAIESSSAPVHVVLKGSAASMAAVILTLAPNSYALERAVVLHHQASVTRAGGNVSDLKDLVRHTEDLYHRINEPVAKKMGKTIPEFVKMMYENNAKGDWTVLGAKAKELRWVDHLVTGIIDESYDSLAADPGPATMADLMRGLGLTERTDAAGKVYYELPPLAPGDSWQITDPHGLYRPAK